MTIFQKLTALRLENKRLMAKLASARFAIVVLSCVIALELFALCLVGGAR